MSPEGIELLRVEEAAEFARSTPGALYVQRARGVEPGSLARKVGKKLVWRKSDLENWANSLFEDE